MQVFHTGVVVLDLEAAMHDVGAATGVDWAVLAGSDFHVWRPGGVEQIHMRVAYSRQAPHLELIEAVAGTFYDTAASQLHHVGVWVDDVEAESTRLAALGMPRVAALLRDDGALPDIVFHENPHGVRLELCATSLRQGFEAWIAGGEFPT